MHAIYDRQYVITCSTLPDTFKSEFRKIVRSHGGRMHDPRTGDTYYIKDDMQCLNIAVVLHDFQILHAGGYTLQDPRNVQAKHLCYLFHCWAQEGLAGSALFVRMMQWDTFLCWLGRNVLLAYLDSLFTTVEEDDISPSEPSGEVIDIQVPLLTRDVVTTVLDEHQGSLRKAARALGTSIGMVHAALKGGGGQPPGTLVGFRALEQRFEQTLSAASAPVPARPRRRRRVSRA